jgi:hypothetical protein
VLARSLLARRTRSTELPYEWYKNIKYCLNECFEAPNAREKCSVERSASYLCYSCFEDATLLGIDTHAFIEIYLSDLSSVHTEHPPSLQLSMTLGVPL